MGQPFTVEEMKEFGFREYEITNIYNFYTFIWSVTCLSVMYLLLFYSFQ